MQLVRTRLPTFSPRTHLPQTDITPSPTWRDRGKSAKERRVRAAKGRQCHCFSHWRTFVCIYCQGKHNVASLYTAGKLINAFPSPSRRLFQAGVQRIRKTVRRCCSISSTNYCCTPNTVAVGELCISASHTLCFNV